MKTIILSILMIGASALVASAQPAITWLSPQAIVNDSDVSTLGTQYFGWNPYNGSPQNVNGVPFTGGPPGFTPLAGLDNGYNAYPPSPSGSSAYNTDLAYGVYTYGGVNAFSWNGMTPGHQYEIQLWDSTSHADRVDQLSGNGGANVNLAQAVTPGSSGYYVIGTFTADSTGSETLTQTEVAGGSYPNINLLQVRDITSVPEPSTLTIVGMGIGAMLLVFRRKNQAA
jgi:hypothetical protein